MALPSGGFCPIDSHSDQMWKSGRLNRNHLTFDVASVQQGGDCRIGRHGLGQDQLSATGILQGTHGLPGGRAEIIKLIVKRGGEGPPRGDVNPKRGVGALVWLVATATPPDREIAVRIASSALLNGHEHALANRLDHGCATGAGWRRPGAECIVDDAEEAGNVSQVVVERIEEARGSSAVTMRVTIETVASWPGARTSPGKSSRKSDIDVARAAVNASPRVAVRSTRITSSRG